MYLSLLNADVHKRTHTVQLLAMIPDVGKYISEQTKMLDVGLEGCEDDGEEVQSGSDSAASTGNRGALSKTELKRRYKQAVRDTTVAVWEVILKELKLASHPKNGVRLCSGSASHLEAAC